MPFKNGDRSRRYRRIQGELLELGWRCSYGTVRNVLRQHGLLPAPRRGQRSWREFVSQRPEQMLAVDFFTVETVWLQRLHVLFFLEIGSRCVHLTGCTASPTGAWVVQRPPSAGLATPGWQDPGPFPAPRSGLQVHSRIRQVFRSEGVEVMIKRHPQSRPRVQVENLCTLISSASISLQFLTL